MNKTDRQATDEQWITSYLTRIGAERPENVNQDGLRHLQERHVLTVPFDTIAFYVGQPVGHSMDAVRKVVEERRGGSCVELNSAFGLLLRALGYDVEIIWGMIYRDSVVDKRPGHMALRVRTPRPWLIDVAHGKHSRHPLRMDSASPQRDPHGTYLVTPVGSGDVDVSVNGELLYRMECRARDEAYGETVVWWLRTSPDSPFVKQPICVQPTENGKYSLLGKTLISESHGKRTVRQITSTAELLATYRECFGIDLAEPPVQSADHPCHPAPPG